MKSMPYFDADFRAVLKIPDQRQYEVFLQYKEYIRRANRIDRLERVLELGSGYSTVLLGLLAKHRGCTVYSVDLSFNTANNAANGTEFEPILKDHVRLVQGATISSSEFNTFYNGIPKTHLGGVSADAARRHFGEYARKLIDLRKWERLSDRLGRMPDQDTLEKLFFTGAGIVFPRNILDIYRQPGDEFDIYDPSKATVKGVLDGVLAENGMFDVIFFDCGEFSSYPEWEKLNGYVRQGGLAVFHDIYFPKSFKNFLLCAAVAGSTGWKVEYLDESTPQGMMIARKL